MKPITVSNISPTIHNFTQKLTSIYQDMNFVYREDLDYVEAIQKYRAENISTEDDNTYPLFVYNRSVLHHPEDGPGRRTQSHHTIKNESDETFRIVHAEFDINFVIADTRASAIEEFEISFLGNEGISSIKKISYELPGFGTWDYFLNFDDLDSKTIQLGENFHKLLNGKVTLRGFYFIAKGNSQRITNLCANVKDLATKIDYQTYTTQV